MSNSSSSHEGPGRACQPMTPKGPAADPSSLIRVKRCRKCNSNFLLGQSPSSPYYKACRCGQSDVEWKRRHEWIPMTMTPSIQPSSPPRSSVPPIPPSILRHQVGKTWNGFSHQFWVVRQRTKEVAGAFGEVFRRVKAAAVVRQFYNPQLPIINPPVTHRRHRKRNGLYKTYWLGRVRRLVSLTTFRRPLFKIRATTPIPVHRSSSAAADREEPIGIQAMTAATPKVKVQSTAPLTTTFEYENAAFEDDLGIRKRTNNHLANNERIIDERDASSGSGSCRRRQNERDLTICEENFSIGSTSSLVVAVLSYGSFAYFVMWLVLYSATLDLILPELKYLHKYVTVCSLLLMISLNCFRFYICQTAAKSQNAYLFTGTKTLTVLVIGALSSLLVTDSYSETPRAFHVIISSIMMTLLVAEGIAMFIHQRLLKRINDERIRELDSRVR